MIEELNKYTIGKVRGYVDASINNNHEEYKLRDDIVTKLSPQFTNKIISREDLTYHNYFGKYCNNDNNNIKFTCRECGLDVVRVTRLKEKTDGMCYSCSGNFKYIHYQNEFVTINIIINDYHNTLFVPLFARYSAITQSVFKDFCNFYQILKNNGYVEICKKLHIYANNFINFSGEKDDCVLNVGSGSDNYKGSDVPPPAMAPAMIYCEPINYDPSKVPTIYYPQPIRNFTHDDDLNFASVGEIIECCVDDEKTGETVKRTYQVCPIYCWTSNGMNWVKYFLPINITKQ